MRITLTLLSLSLGLLLNQSLRAQVVYHGPDTIINGGTNNIAATTTNSYFLRIDAPRSEEFGLLVSAKPITTNIVTLRILLYGSLDGTTYSTLPTHQFTYTGTTNVSGGVVSIVTNITAGGIPYWFLTAGNTEGVAATNLTVSYGQKRDR